MFRKLSALIRLVLLLGLLGVATAATATAIAPQLASVLGATSSESIDIELASLATRSKVYDGNGDLIDTLQEDENRELVKLAQIPDEVIQAVIAVEDDRFYEHEGINLKAVFRAAVENVGAGGVSQGGSTITQQIIKNLVLTPEQSLDRKIREAALAMRLEDETTKDELLELYLNTVYFGNGAYGVQAAAEVYWGEDVEDLGWVEGAMLAALISAPGTYDPLRDINGKATRQREIVLDRLASLDLISKEDARLYKRESLPTQKNELDLPPQDYYLDLVRQLVLGERTDDPGFDATILGETASERFDTVFRGGLKIYTGFDPEAQAMAIAAQQEVLPQTEEGFTMAIAAIEPSTGAVKALVGGQGFENEQYNIALQQPGRQPGSSFKTFVLIAALEAGFTPVDTISGIGPCRFEDRFADGGVYEVSNFGNSIGAVDTLTAQTLRSSNCTYVRLGKIVGLDKVAEVAKALGVKDDVLQVSSLPLGTDEVPPIEMASAYATIANGGVRNDPYYIERIEDADGEIIYEHKQRGRRVIDEDIACWTTEVLAANVRGGTGTAAAVPDQPAGGKTGTTEDFGDAWFVGFTPHLATAVWMGHPDTNIIKMRNVGGLSSVTGGSFPAQAWGNFNTRYHEDLTPIAFDDCAPYSRGGKFIRPDGELGGYNPCPDPNQYPVDLNGTGAADICYENPGAFGFALCGYTDAIDGAGNPVPLYCGAEGGTAGTPDAGAPGVPDPAVAPPPPPPPPPGATAFCPSTHPNGVDEDGDGVIDICYQ